MKRCCAEPRAARLCARVLAEPPKGCWSCRPQVCRRQCHKYRSTTRMVSPRLSFSQTGRLRHLQRVAYAVSHCPASLIQLLRFFKAHRTICYMTRRSQLSSRALKLLFRQQVCEQQVTCIYVIHTTLRLHRLLQKHQRVSNACISEYGKNSNQLLCSSRD